MRLPHWVLILAVILAACRGSAGPAPSASVAPRTRTAPVAGAPTDKTAPDAGQHTAARPDVVLDGGARGFDPFDPAFSGDRESFTPKLPPRPGDWLAWFPETGTSFDETLAWNLRFDVRRRYAALLSIYQREGLTELAGWTEARLQKIRAGR